MVMVAEAASMEVPHGELVVGDKVEAVLFVGRAEVRTKGIGDGGPGLPPSRYGIGAEWGILRVVCEPAENSVLKDCWVLVVRTACLSKLANCHWQLGTWLAACCWICWKWRKAC